MRLYICVHACGGRAMVVVELVKSQPVRDGVLPRTRDEEAGDGDTADGNPRLGA